MATFRKPAPEVAAALDAAAKATGIEVALLRAIAHTESSFNPKVEGPPTSKGWRAQGLMQLGPEARKGVSNVFDPHENALAGAKLLAGYLRRYQNDTPAALAAYNWGPARVDKKHDPSEWPGEVRSYVDKVLARATQERRELETSRERTPLQAAQDLAAFLASTQRFGSKDGDRAAEVRAAQRDLGVDPDGIIGPKTREAAIRQGVQLPQPKPKGAP